MNPILVPPVLLLLVMNDIYFLEGGWRGRLITSHISLMGWQCETTYVCPWQLQQIHQGKPYPTTALTVVWPTPQMWCKVSLAVLPLKNLHLRWSQTTAARSLVGLYCGSCVRDEGWGRMTFSSRDRAFFCSGLQGVDLGLDSGIAPGH